MIQLIIVTGLSGSGKSVALHTLEDEGYYCVDNLPSGFLAQSIDLLLSSGVQQYDRIAIGIDMRSEGRSTDGLLALLQQLRQRTDLRVEVLFLDTDRGTLVKRFSETRRKHPLSGEKLPLVTAIDEEARLLESVKAEADLVIDTSALTLHELRGMIRTYLLKATTTVLSLTFQSFGFKHGAPASTDFMFDVRCLPNPHWEPDLRAYTGQQAPIVEFLEQKSDVIAMLNDIEGLLDRWLPLFEAENRAYLTVSVGCTGGRHRSVYLVERLAEYYSTRRDNVSIRHRELG